MTNMFYFLLISTSYLAYSDILILLITSIEWYFFMIHFTHSFYTITYNCSVHTCHIYVGQVHEIQNKTSSNPNNIYSFLSFRMCVMATAKDIHIAHCEKKRHPNHLIIAPDSNSSNLLQFQKEYPQKAPENKKVQDDDHISLCLKMFIHKLLGTVLTM